MGRFFPRLVSAVALVMVASLATMLPASDAAPRPAATERVQLREADNATESADVKVGNFSRIKGYWRSDVVRTSGFSMVGVTWKKNIKNVPDLRLRVRAGGGWGQWQKMDVQEDLPAVSEASKRDGTHPVWTGRASDLQLAAAGDHPPVLTIAVINAGVRPADSRIKPNNQTALRAGGATQRARSAPEPAIRTRSQWGANPNWRNGKPTYNWTIKQIQLHHTAGANGYSRSDVPAILRGIYRYHTHSLGWFDIGYNFLVDKFGRLWVGRSGGYRKSVRGAHTLGFNHMSVGVSVIGSYSRKRVPDAVVRSIIKVSAWKLDPYNRNPNGKVLVQSHGSDKYRDGLKLRLPVILGHRATNDTACPGAMMGKRIGFIRWRTKQRVDNFN